MTAVHNPFLLYAGDTWEFDAALHDNVGDPLDLTGAEIIWRLRNAAGAVMASLGVGAGILVLNAAGGTCRIILPPAATALLAAGNYRDEIWALTQGGFSTTQAVGSIVVMKAGSPAAGPDLAAELAALKKARRSGEKRVKIENFEREYRTDAELAAAIAATESEIARTSGTPPVRNVYHPLESMELTYEKFRAARQRGHADRAR